MRYLWIIILFSVWVIWGIIGILEIRDTTDYERSEGITDYISDIFIFCDIFRAWIVTTLVFLFMVSLISFLAPYISEVE